MLKTPAKYTIVVLHGFAADFGVYAMLVGCGLSIYLANIVGFFVGATVNVILIRRFVFPEARFNLGRDIVLTLLSNGMMLAVGLMLLWILVEMLHIGVYFAKVYANGVTFILNYLTRRTFFGAK